MSVKLLIELNLVFLSITGGCTGSSESTLVKMAHCWKPHVTVQTFAVGKVSGYRCVSDFRSWCPEFDRSPVEIDHEIISTVIFLPSAESFSKKVVVSYKRKYALKLLVYFD